MNFPFSYPIALEHGEYNELLTPEGELRPQWQTFFTALEAEGFDKLPFFAEQVTRFMKADELTAVNQEKHTYGFIPFLLSKEDFSHISAGLIQRARLINQTLADLYGDQTLISNGIIPPGVIFGHPSFLPALKGIKPADGIFLREYAVEIERAPDGHFWVVKDETQTPSGSGTVIKNRLVLSRVMPTVYAKTAPRRIVDFFDSLRRHLIGFAPKSEKYNTPCIILLSKGGQEGLSSEDAFFARNLGISAVEAADLSVRNNYVYLKNIGGLKRVDVILRRIDDDLCDPLELNGSSLFGIAGLVEALRAGRVALVNPLGTGLGQIPALRPFIAGISRFLTQEDLLLPSVATWWCGQEKERNEVLENLENLSVFNASDGSPIKVGASKIKENPSLYVAQENVNASVMPILHHGQIVPAKTTLRFHLIYDNGEYRVLDGGLALTRHGHQTSIRDIWIPRTEKEKIETGVFLPSEMQAQMRPVRKTFELTSRTADNMFWMGRELERSEGLARILRSTIRRSVESPEIPEPDDMATLFSILAILGHLPFNDYRNHENQPGALSELKYVIGSPSYPVGLYTLFQQMKEKADRLHDRLSMDTWEILTQLPHLLPDPQANGQIILNRLNTIILQQNALSGLIRENMTREHSWRFMEIGRRLERGLHVLSLMSGVEFCAKNGFNASLETLLEVSDSRMTYRARYMAVPTVPLVFDLLICDDTNPRALIYQVLKLRQNISVMERESNIDGLFSNEAQILFEMQEMISRINVMTLAEHTNSPEETVMMVPAVAALLKELEEKLLNFSDTLTLSCFVHAASTRQGPSYAQGKSP